VQQWLGEKMRKTLLISFAAVSMSAAQAAFIIETHPGRFTDTENILFNDPMILTMGPMVQGKTNESEILIDYFGAGEDLMAGQARIRAVDNGFTDITVDPDVAILGMGAYQFALDPVEAGEVTLDVFEAGSLKYSETFAIDTQGPNWFTVYSTEDDVISSLDISSTVDIERMTHNRVMLVPEPVPEPSSALALVAGIGIVTVARRRR
jgi:hypothetical protein